MKDLVRVSDLSPDGLARLLNLAAAAKRSPHAWSGVLAGDTVVCYLAMPSTRTRLSFAAAVARLGGVAEFVGPPELQLGRGETIEDTARVISRYTRAFVIRTFADEDIRCFAENASIPVVNALSDAHHPCQALADLLTLREHFGSFENLKVAYVGDGNNVAHSLLEACALAGIDIAVATPAGYAPRPEVVATAKLLALDSGAKVTVTDDPHQAASGAAAVYTNVWVSTGTAESERIERSNALLPYRVDDALLAEARADAVFLHCLPAHRGDEVTTTVIDGPRSLVFDQAENRLHTATAVLAGLLNGSVTGASDRAPVGAAT